MEKGWSLCWSDASPSRYFSPLGQQDVNVNLIRVSFKGDEENKLAYRLFEKGKMVHKK